METPILLENEEGSFEKKHFNRLVQRVRKLKNQNEEKQKLLNEAKQYITVNVSPYALKLMDIKVEILQLLDKTYQSGLFTYWEKTKLHEIISNRAFDLSYRYQNEEAEQIYKKYQENAPDKGIKDLADFSENLFRSFWGEIFDPTKDEKNKQNETKINFHEPKIRFEEQIQQGHDMVDTEKMISQTLKSLYNHLAKKLHPDLEIDAEKKIEKNEIMQRVTIAYKQNDIFELLQIANDVGINLTLLEDEQTLQHLILLLKNQVRKLEFSEQLLFENEEEKIIFQAFCTDGKVNFEAIDQQKKIILKDCATLKNDLEMFGSTETLRRHLRL